jgi:dihydropteroate synthase
MGILNVNTDSFFDGGRYLDLDDAKRQVERMVEEGVDIIDVGGASSRPGADEVSVEQEKERVLPVIEYLTGQVPEIPVSVDTYRAEVAKQAVKVGASIVNDISAGDDDPAMLQMVADLHVPYIAMHKQGVPKTMQDNPTYDDVTVTVLDYFRAKLKRFGELGIHDVILDPGFGFGKTVAHNYQLLRNFSALENVLNCPMLVGVSRKSMINKVLGTKAAEALNGTTVLNTIGLMNGAKILRVHDVKEAREAVQLYKTYINA